MFTKNTLFLAFLISILNLFPFFIVRQRLELFFGYAIARIQCINTPTCKRWITQKKFTPEMDMIFSIYCLNHLHGQNSFEHGQLVNL